MYIIPILTLAILILLYLFSIRPHTKRRPLATAFCNHAFAHRGLYSADTPENTIPAFIRAAQEGVGIELDVRLTKDGAAVVFHDDTLQRAAGIDAAVADLTYSELQEIKIFDSEETIPLFSDVLKQIKDTPLLVEIKAVFDCAALCENVANQLKGYAGDVAIESFSPLALRWFAKHRPEYLRGQLSSRFAEEGEELPFWQRFVVTNLLTNFIAKPDFIAYDVRHRHQISFVICRKLFKPPVLLWTVFEEKAGCIFERRK